MDGRGEQTPLFLIPFKIVHVIICLGVVARVIVFWATIFFEFLMVKNRFVWRVIISLRF